MARLRRDAPASELVVMDEEALSAGNAALTAQAQAVSALMSAYGVTSCDPSVLEAEIRGAQQTAAEVMLGIGARLLLLRELCDRGEWLPMLDRLGLAERGAQRIMQATRKFGARGREQLLGGLSQGQMMELLTCDDDTLDQLEQDVERVRAMSMTQLRAEVRKLALDNEAKDKLLATRAEKIEGFELAAAAPYVPRSGAAAQTAAEQVQYEALVAAHVAAVLAVAALFKVAGDVADVTPSQAMGDAAHHAVAHLARYTSECIGLAGFRVDFEVLVDPEWMGAQALDADERDEGDGATEQVVDEVVEVVASARPKRGRAAVSLVSSQP